MLSRGMIWEIIQGHYVGNMIYGDELYSLEYIYMYCDILSNSICTVFCKSFDLYYIRFSVKLGV